MNYFATKYKRINPHTIYNPWSILHALCDKQILKKYIYSCYYQTFSANKNKLLKMKVKKIIQTCIL